MTPIKHLIKFWLGLLV